MEVLVVVRRLRMLRFPVGAADLWRNDDALTLIDTGPASPARSERLDDLSLTGDALCDGDRVFASPSGASRADPVRAGGPGGIAHRVEHLGVGDGPDGDRLRAR
jgi:hypothetical protein